MSADNGIYILVTKDQHRRVNEYTTINTFTGIEAYRVAHAQAIDNLEWYEDNQPYNVGYFLHAIWGDSEVFYSADEAYAKAKEILKDVGYTEYGIGFIERTQYRFPNH